MSESRTVEFARHSREGQRHDILVSLDKIQNVLEGLRFGSITLTVHDARVVQIDVTEKTRLTA